MPATNWWKPPEWWMTQCVGVEWSHGEKIPFCIWHVDLEATNEASILENGRWLGDACKYTGFLYLGEWWWSEKYFCLCWSLFGEGFQFKTESKHFPVEPECLAANLNTSSFGKVFFFKNSKAPGSALPIYSSMIDLVSGRSTQNTWWEEGTLDAILFSNVHGWGAMWEKIELCIFMYFLWTSGKNKVITFDVIEWFVFF